MIVQKKIHPVVYETQEETVATNEQPFDYRHFLDFGFFSNIGAQFGGAHTPGNGQVVVEKTYYAPPPPVRTKV